MLQLGELSKSDIAVLPAVMELQYAGRCLIEFIDLRIDQSDDRLWTSDEMLHATLRHVIRAKQNAIDVILHSAMEVVARGNPSINNVQEDMKFLRSIRTKIIESTDKPESRDQAYNNIAIPVLHDVIALIDKYALSVPQDQRLGGDNEKPKEVDFSVLLAAIGGVVSAVIGMMIALVGF